MSLKHFALFYEAVPDMMEKRTPHRPGHVALLKEYDARGQLELAGAFPTGVPGSLMVFRGETEQVAKDFAEADPYVQAGLITNWYVREWTTVVGEKALSPV